MFSLKSQTETLVTAFLIAAVVISGLYAVIGSIYNATSLEVKRCDSVTKSPILVGFGEVLHGQTSIRAYADTARFTRELMTRLETNMYVTKTDS